MSERPEFALAAGEVDAEGMSKLSLVVINRREKGKRC